MSANDQARYSDPLEQEEDALRSGKSYSRREFLKVAGIAGAAVGVGAGLGGLLTACGEETTETTGSETTQATTATTAGPTTTASAGVETGREIKFGTVSPLTGPAAAFGIPDKWIVNQWLAAAGDGIVFGDGMKHPVSFELLDSQSDTNRAAQVAGDLIQNTGIDMMLVSSSPDTVNPVADQCEAMEMPCLSTDCPMEPWYFGRGATPDKPFKWTYLAFWGNWELMELSKELWVALPNNHVVGGVWSKEVDGDARRGAITPLVVDELGWKLVDDGGYHPGQEDWSATIGLFKKEAVEIMCFLGTPPDWTNFWQQCQQQGYKPVIADIAKATLFPTAMEALGQIGYGLVGPQWWHPLFPWKSTLTGQNCQELALAFEQDTGFQWTQPLMHYVTFEWAVDVYKRVTDLEDKEMIMKAVAETKMADSMAGPIDFTAPVAPKSLHIVPNCVGTPLYEGQWVPYPDAQWPWDTKKWMYDMKVVTNKMAPQIELQGPLEPLA